MKRYRAQEGITPLTSHVMDTEAEPFTKPLASTRTLKDAEDIAAALNHHQGAVEAARDADVASMQAAFWRARAIELGADPGEWRKRDREVFGGQS
jgi:hypothetical protein